MSEIRKLKHSGITSAVATPLKASRSQRVKKWARNLLGGALLFTGCSTTNITNNYYPSLDGGTQATDARAQEDTNGQTDASACVPNNTPLTCSDSVLAAGTVEAGQSLPLGLKYRLVLDDFMVQTDRTYALISLTDSCGAVLDKYKIAEGETKTLMLDGQPVLIAADEVAAGYSFGAKFAKFAARAPCPQTDAGVQCVPNSVPVSCSDSLYGYVFGQLNQGESFDIQDSSSQAKYRLMLNDIEVHGNEVKAIFSILNTCHHILFVGTLGAGESTSIFVNGEQIDVKVTQIMPGYTFGSKAAVFHVKIPCTHPAWSPWCLSVSGMLDQGNSMQLNDLSFKVDDLMEDSGKWYALLSVLDANGNTLKKLKIGENDCTEFTDGGGNRYKIAVPTIGAGYTFGAKWAEVKVFTPTQSTCTSELNYDQCTNQ